MVWMDWEAVRNDGFIYRRFKPCCLAEDIDREAFAGASWEGWVSLWADINNPTVAVYQRGTTGETWFRLR